MSAQGNIRVFVEGGLDFFILQNMNMPKKLLTKAGGKGKIAIYAKDI